MNLRKIVKFFSFSLSMPLAVIGVLNNRVELVISSSLLIWFLFFEKLPGRTRNLVDFIPKNFLNESNRNILVSTLFISAFLCTSIAVVLAKLFPDTLFSVFPWILAVCILISAGFLYDRPQIGRWWSRLLTDRKMVRRLILESFIVISITTIAFVLRSTNLNAYPPFVHGDEGEMGMEALRVLGKGDPLPLFGTGWFHYPNLFFYLQAGSLRLFGENIVGLRMLSALFGTACIPLIYLIARKYWGMTAAVVSSWLLAVSHISIQYSRLGINNIQSVFFTILFVLIFLTGFPSLLTPSLPNHVLKEDDDSPPKPSRAGITYLIAAGMIAALSQYFYVGSRLIPVLAFVLVVYLLHQRQIGLIQVFVFVFSALVVYAPLGSMYLQSPADVFLGRMDTVSIFDPQNVRNAYGAGVTWSKDALLILSGQFVKNLRFFMQSGDLSSFYYPENPAFDLLSAALFWLGSGFVISRLHRLPEFVLFIWFGLGLILGGVLTNDSPNGPRLLVIIPVVFLVAGIFVQKLFNEGKRLIQRIPGLYLSPAWLLSPFLALLLIATMIVNYNFYFIIFPISSGRILPIYLAREIAADAPFDHVYLLGSGDIYVGYGTIRFVAGVGKAEDLLSPEDLPPQSTDGKGLTILLSGSHFGDVDILKTHYPQGVLTLKKDPMGRTIFMKYHIAALANR